MRRHSEKDTARVFTRRAAVVAGIKAAALAALGTRLGYLQIAQGRRYKTLAEENRVNLKLLPALRGQIFDRFNVPLAVNRQDYRVAITRERTPDIEATLTALQVYIPLSENQLKSIRKDLENAPRFLPVTVAERLSWAQLAQVEAHLPELPGVSVEEGRRRDYPLGPGAAHLVGYVGAVTEKELKESQDPALAMPDAFIGKTGVERKLQPALRGLDGSAEVEINASGREVRTLSRREGQSGYDAVLTIDAELQLFVQERLAKEVSASAVIMDAKTGALYAMGSHPTFDPNLFSYGLSNDIWQALLGNTAKPLSNKATSGSYPPGSTFKMVTGLAALEYGHINHQTVVYCPGHYDLGSHRFHCWKRGGHGLVDVIKSLEQSCDTFFYEISQLVGIDAIAETANTLGLGTATSLGFLEEVSGLIPNKAWKRGRFGKPWLVGETILAAIGQGYVQSTPLQLAVMTARLLQNREVSPYVVATLDGRKTAEQRRKPDDFKALDFKPEYLSLLRSGMDRVVNFRKGTAFSHRIQEEGMEMGGKTGTSQVRRISMDERRAGVKNEELPWRYRNHALFVGYAPVHDPRYVACTVVEHGVSGSAAAAPIVRDLLLETQKRKPDQRDVGL